MAESTSITDALSKSITHISRWHERPYDLNSGDVERVNARLVIDEARELDTYPVEHGLDPAELRILFKILARELPECGRKRGAILRYINAYKQPKQQLGKDLHRFLKNKT
jgi:hypothetical protein